MTRLYEALRVLCVFILGNIVDGYHNSHTALPHFTHLKQFYPAPSQFRLSFAGGISNHQLKRRTGFKDIQNMENLRLSWSLNLIGGRHVVKPDHEELSIINGQELSMPRYSVEKDSESGHYFVLHDFEMGPYLSVKYGHPKQLMVDAFKTREDLESKISGSQGIVRFIMRNGTYAHVGLWNCNGVLFTLDRLYDRKLESVELWATDDPRCDEGF